MKNTRSLSLGRRSRGGIWIEFFVNMRQTGYYSTTLKA
jgi:hypothetical protein